VRLVDATWPDVGRARRRSDDGTLAPVLLIPVGSTEQHGPHLPIGTDSLIAEELAGRAVHHTDGLMVGPTISITASGEHAGFPGTLSIGTATTTALLVELVRSADWAAGVVLVNGHGGNHAAVTAATRTLHSEGRTILVWWPTWPALDGGGPADLHAGRIETSLMLAIDPGLVRLQLAAAGPDATIDELDARGVRAVSPSGVLGDPEGASGGEGEQLITALVEDLVHQIERWRPIAP
jgi:mycofactocin precursor peptide peptidase